MNPKQAARRAMMMTLLFDLGVAAMAMAIACIMVWLMSGTGAGFPLDSLLFSVFVFTTSAAGAFHVRGIPKQVWRHLGRPDMYALLQAVLLTMIVSLAALLLANDTLYRPLESLALAVVLFTAGIFGGRSLSLFRTTAKPFQFFRKVPAGRQAILLVGDDISCRNVLRWLQGSDEGRQFEVQGVIETGDEHSGRSIHGASVLGGTAQLVDVLGILAERYGSPPWIAVTGAARGRASMMTVIEAAALSGTKVMALSDDAAAHRLAPVDTADLLARAERRLDPRPVHRLLNGSSVLVTGGGGTIGAELVRQSVLAGPKHIGIVDSSEFNLYTIDLTLSEFEEPVPRSLHLGDVRDLMRLDSIFGKTRPEVVIHAAALKHVPLMEHNICEAILTNVQGAINTARRAVESGASRFVLISTDKAVDPDNVMGATKRLAEIAVARIAEGSGMAVSIVRFGNVLGSSGSVVPLFERQIARGGPVTVTDPEATRYFMTLEEASSLVLQAAALNGVAGEAALYVLDMGEPIKIGQLAETMIRLKGMVPHQDIKIEQRGLREGEKMHEALTYEDEELTETGVDGVHRVKARNGHSEIFDKRLVELIAAASARNESESVRLLGVLVPEYGRSERVEERRRRSLKGISPA